MEAASSAWTRSSRQARPSPFAVIGHIAFVPTPDESTTRWHQCCCSDRGRRVDVQHWRNAMFSSRNHVKRAARWLVATLVAGGCLLASPGSVRPALAETYVDVLIAPPAPRVEVVPLSPSP